jgi:crossover junction endodeoxyribonuclease RuvC
MRILALDLSTVASGYCILDSLMSQNKPVTWGVVEPDSDFSEIEKYFYITSQIATIMRMYRPDDLVIEDTFYSKDPTVLKKLNRLAGQIMYLWFKFKSKSVYFYMPMTVRKSIPGLKGTATKEEIVEAVNKFFGMRGKVTNHNAADAFVLAYHHLIVNSTDITQAVEHAEAVERVRVVKAVKTKKTESPDDFLKITDSVVKKTRKRRLTTDEMLKKGDV